MKLKNYPVKKHDIPFVSISCISYNQEDYIGNTIEYFLNQEVDYPVEILIHDDASTDKTQEIIRFYTEKYPLIIKPILQEKNQLSQGAKCIHATYNFYRSKGKYIGTCEGDDYWIDSLKLRKQIDFLEKNEKFSMTSHEAYQTNFIFKKNIRSFISILYRNLILNGFNHFLNIFILFLKNNPDFWKKRRKAGERKKIADLDYLLNNYHKNIYIPTLSILGRGEILRALPKEILLTPSGHKEHIFWCAMYGKIRHFKEVMGQRNRQPNSLTITNLYINVNDIKERVNHFKSFYSSLMTYSNENQKKLLTEAIKNIQAFYGQN